MAVLHEHELHYRCSFELTSLKPSEKMWSELVRLVRSWISGRFSSEQDNLALGAKWFFVGGEWRPPKQSRVFVKTEKCIGIGSDLVPQSWAIRFEHPDSQVNARQWRTDIGISLSHDKKLFFSLSTIHWLSPGYIGQEPEAPAPTAPRIVSQVLNHKSWEVHAGSEMLGTIPFLLREGNAEHILPHLEDPSRGCPLVLVAKDFSTGSALIEPRKLARLLGGAAVVWESESSWVDKELEQLLSRDFSCWNGMVRVYQPRVNLRVITDARRHRYFDKNQIETLGAGKVEELLVRGIVRRSRPFNASGIASIEDVQAKQAHTRFAEDLKRAARGSQEWTALLDQEIERLKASLKEKDSEIAFLQGYGEDADELRDEVARLKYEIKQAIARAQEAESVRSALATQASLLRNLDHLPDSMPEILDLIARIYSDRIIFTEKARESAKILR